MENPQGTPADVRYEGDRFLKVSPNLFTQERLHLFDSLQLYTSLMKCSKSVEQGERLHNLSWRIVNKALLKDGNVNKSKKRDGVKNLYYVVAPGKSGTASGAHATVPQPAKPSQPVQPVQQALPAQPVQPVKPTQPVPFTPARTPGSSSKLPARPPTRPLASARAPAPAPAPMPARSETSTKPANAPVSLFGKRDQAFYSSEDDGSDWDGLSESASSDEEGNFDDEEEEDSYYRNQWDKLLEKQPRQQEPLKKSLLSGLFLNEQGRANRSDSVTPPHMNANNVPQPAPVPHAAATATSTSNVTAVGSVTSPQESLAKAVPTALYPQGSTSRGSFSSIVSESTKERYLHESNAPPAAQTILPRALSTHMFLPNNVHQQRLAVAMGDSDMSESPSQSPPLSIPLRRVERRTSMDIPGKKNGLLKTRMEISEEERLSRASRRKL